MSGADLSHARALFVAGSTLAEVSAVIGISIDRLKRASAREGWAAARAQAQGGPLAPLAPVAAAASGSLTDQIRAAIHAVLSRPGKVAPADLIRLHEWSVSHDAPRRPDVAHMTDKDLEDLATLLAKADGVAPTDGYESPTERREREIAGLRIEIERLTELLTENGITPPRRVAPIRWTAGGIDLSAVLPKPAA